MSDTQELQPANNIESKRGNWASHVGFVLAATGSAAAATVQPTAPSTSSRSSECVVTSPPATTSSGAPPRVSPNARSSAASSATSPARSTRRYPEPTNNNPSTKPLDKHRSIEPFHRIDEEESYRMLDGVVIDDTKLFNEKLQEWEDFYNFNRPHGALDGQTPYERLRQKTQNPM